MPNGDEHNADLTQRTLSDERLNEPTNYKKLSLNFLKSLRHLSNNDHKSRRPKKRPFKVN